MAPQSMPKAVTRMVARWTKIRCSICVRVTCRGHYTLGREKEMGERRKERSGDMC